jgi:7-cyano-7-deazaguanine reductase
MSDTKDLTLLGSQGTVYENTYNPEILETFENQFPKNNYEVEIEIPEFTHICPKTGQPDFATILIKYVPNDKLVESKALKLYMFSFRQHGSFHEDCINTIATDLNKLMHPKWIEVRGDFYPRGGISINPTVRITNESNKT